MKNLFDNRGRTWECVSCKSGFFIPELILSEQRKIGCPICTKNKWRLIPYSSLFIKDTSKLGLLSNENQLNRGQVGYDTQSVREKEVLE